jgi:DNA-binding YbaB/EbfC family protein
MNQKGMGDLLKQVTKMKKDMDRVNDDLKNRYIEEQSGGGLITVTVNGQREVVKIAIDPSALQIGDDGQADLEMFEDLLIAAINQAVGKSKDMMNEEMNTATGGLSAGLPGLF